MMAMVGVASGSLQADSQPSLKSRSGFESYDDSTINIVVIIFIIIIFF